MKTVMLNTLSSKLLSDLIDVVDDLLLLPLKAIKRRALFYINIVYIHIIICFSGWIYICRLLFFYRCLFICSLLRTFEVHLRFGRVFDLIIHTLCIFFFVLFVPRISFFQVRTQILLLLLLFVLLFLL